MFETAVKPLLEKAGIVVRQAVPADASGLVTMWENALGPQGVWQQDCDPYPDPTLFSVAGMQGNLIDPGRQIVLAEDSSHILGAMIIDWLSPYHCEHNCMAARRDAYGRGIGTLLVEGATRLLSERDLAINCTELVTHSMASQSAHINHGYNSICGFGYAHYPRVFSPAHRESVLWIWRLFRRPVPGDLMAAPLPEIIGQLATIRKIHIEPKYKHLVQSIVNQITSDISYQLEASDTSAGQCQLSIDAKPGQGHFYIDVEQCGDAGSFSEELVPALRQAEQHDKRFVLVRINANDPGCPQLTAWLRSRGFCFHSFLPVYRHCAQTNQLSDLLCMQWLHPEEVARNPLPGTTNSFMKIYGYPLNMSREIIRTIAREVKP